MNADAVPVDELIVISTLKIAKGSTGKCKQLLLFKCRTAAQRHI